MIGFQKREVLCAVAYDRMSVASAMPTAVPVVTVLIVAVVGSAVVVVVVVSSIAIIVVGGWIERVAWICGRDGRDRIGWIGWVGWVRLVAGVTRVCGVILVRWADHVAF